MLRNREGQGDEQLSLLGAEPWHRGVGADGRGGDSGQDKEHDEAGGLLAPGFQRMRPAPPGPASREIQ